MVQTRKSTRTRNLTTKAKQFQEQSTTPSTSNQVPSIIKKPILRSISTIDDDESTYNNISFKKRRISPSPSSDVSKKSTFNVSHYKNDIDDDDLIENELLDNSDDENIFNSDDDEYYSAISDYEIDSKPKFLSSKKLNNRHHTNTTDLHLNQSPIMDFEDVLFDSDASDSSKTSITSNNTPTSAHFNIGHNVVELKSLEENFQKIINENQQKAEQQPSSFKTPIKIIQEDATQDVKSALKFDEFVNYTEDEEESDDSTEGESNTTQFKKHPSILHYRHDEKHNLAFPDVSTFPIRFDPMIKKKNQKNIRALNRRAILSGKASEMVGTGITVGEFNLF